MGWLCGGQGVMASRSRSREEEAVDVEEEEEEVLPRGREMW